MSLDYVESIDEFNSPLVHIANRARVNILLGAIITDGKDNIQVLSDFDGTITKSFDNVDHANTYAVLKRCPSISSKRESLKELEINYHCVERNSEIGYVEKDLLLSDILEKLMENIKGATVSSEEFTRTVIESIPPLREGTERLLDDLSKANVPVVLCTAGFGNSAEVILRHLGVLSSNIKVGWLPTGNFFSFNEGKIQLIKNAELVTTINKKKLLVSHPEIADFLKDRSNFIVLGDAVTDADMADKIQNAKHILKIGFRCSDNYYTVADFLEVFDIVIEDSSTVNVVQAIFNRILM